MQTVKAQISFVTMWTNHDFLCSLNYLGTPLIGAMILKKGAQKPFLSKQ